MENVMLTQHASYRFAQRIKGQCLINQQSYSALIKTEPDKCNRLNDELSTLLKEATFLIQGMFDKDNKTSNFYLHKDERIIFVLTSSNDKLITLYKVDYGFGDEVNTITMKALLKEIDKLKSNKDKLIAKNSKDIDLKQNAISSLEFDINLLKDKMNNLETQKAIIEAEIDLYNNTIAVTNKEIESKSHIVAHSIGYKVNEEFN